VKTAVIGGALVALLLLNLFVSGRVLRCGVPRQRLAWVLLIWVAPVVGAVLALQVSFESSAAPQARQQSKPDQRFGFLGSDCPMMTGLAGTPLDCDS
jgi:hypothetical protein